MKHLHQHHAGRTTHRRIEQWYHAACNRMRSAGIEVSGGSFHMGRQGACVYSTESRPACNYGAARYVINLLIDDLKA